MLPESVNTLYGSLRSVIQRFKAPALRAYFLRKAESDFNGIERRADGERRTCGMKAYLETQGMLLDVLKRQTVIYNMFHDESSNI